MRTSLAPWMLIGVLGLFIGCSGSGHSPLAPGTVSPTDTAPPAPAAPLATSDPATPAAPIVFNQFAGPLPVGIDPGDDSLSGQGAMGLFGMRIDPAALTATLEPLTRSGQLGEDYEVDITDFFRNSPCSDCLQVKGLSLNVDGDVVVDMALRHAFALPSPGTGRLDLHLFDIELQLAVPGISGDPGFITYPEIDTRPKVGVNSNLKIMKPGFLRNADGYASHLTRVIDSITNSEATAYPFIIMKVEAPVPGQFNPATVSGFTDLRAPVGYNVLGMGQSATGSLVLNFEGAEQVGVVLALDARYGISARGNIPLGQPGNRRSPRYFLPEFSRKEAWRVTPSVTSNSLLDNSAVSFATIDVAVNDWQQSLGTVIGTVDFATSPLDSLRLSSKVAAVELAVPALMNGKQTQTVAASGDGSVATPLLYNFSVQNTLLAPAGDYVGILAVRDEYRAAPPANGGVERDGVTLFSMSDYSTYQLFTLTVTAGNAPPTCSLVATPPGGSVPHRTMILLDATATTDDTDPPGSLTYEWDLDYDGLTFDVDATGVSLTPTLNNATAAAVVRVIALRVRDTGGASCAELTISFTIQPNNVPTCNVFAIPSSPNVSSGQSIGLSGATSSDVEDPFASLTFDWDTNYNGSLFVPNPLYTGQNSFAYLFTNGSAAPVNQVIAMRVTDTDGGACIGTLTFTVSPNQKPVALITRAVAPPSGTGIWSVGGPYPNLTDTVPLYINRTATLDFDGSSSFDVDGTVVAWDWDYENINANSADFGVGFVSDQMIQNPTPHSYNTYGSTFVALRATDNVGAFGYHRREVMITPWQPQVYAEVSGNRTDWQTNKDTIGTALSRVGNNVFLMGYCANNAGAQYQLQTAHSTNAGSTWIDRVVVDNATLNSLRSGAIDGADGLLPYAAFLDISGNLAFRKATSSSPLGWSPASAAARKVIAVGAYPNGKTVDIAVSPAAVGTVVIGVIGDSSGGIVFWKSTDAQNGGTSTWSQLTGVFFPLVGGATTRTTLDIAYDAGGDVHAVWRDVKPGPDLVTYAQLSAAGTGTSYGSQSMPASTGVEGSLDPQIWIDSSARPLVVWSDDRNGSKDIFLVRGTAANVPVFTAPLQVNTDSTKEGRAAIDRDQTSPSVCTDGAGNIWIGWEDSREDTFGFALANAELYGTVLNSSLALVASDHPINNFDPYNLVNDRFPWLVTDRVAPASGANAVTAFWAGDTDGGTSELFGARATLQ